MAPVFLSPPNRALFDQEVYALVMQIPAGMVATYGQIAGLISIPAGVDFVTYRAQGARWVGSAMAACPDGIPWQRVINAQGKISLPGASGERQRQLLEAEGVPFDEKGRVSLKRYGWAGPE